MDAPTLRFERQAWREGAVIVAGVDEVGVGPLAGPVTGGAVALRAGRRFSWFKDVRDSKVLSASRREELAARIVETVPATTASVSNEEIDRIGILPARRLCMMRAIEKLPECPDFVISDALDLPVPRLRAVIRGDALSVAVAAASVVAKVDRDALMRRLSEEFPAYNFARHKGYPTPEHRRLLREFGPCPIHRRSFNPVSQMVLPL